MKRIFLFMAVLFACVSCFDDSLLWESINDHESRISELEKICKEMNTNISSLQKLVNALQNNDYITNVSPVKDGGDVIGYVIDFSLGESITIYYGKDGKDGQDGAPGKDGQNGENGATPIIGVKQDVDGVYYWTLNGDWLLDDNGNKVKAEGVAGADGQDGADGVIPQLKIEDGFWYVSYDNGATWTQLGQATGDKGDQGEQGPQGPQGDAGLGGDSMFINIDYSSSKDYVIFILSNGTQMKVPTWSAFETLQTQCDQMNSNIEALQVIVNALQNNDYVTGVNPIYEGGKEVGYIITFSKSGSVTIYHGQDGKDGQNGTPGKDGEDGEDGKDGVDGEDGKDGLDGTTPIIGVQKDVDGVYYWTLNGEWLLDADGNKVKAQGTDGTSGNGGASGTPSAPGKDGADGVTPQLKIEDGYWFVSYDNGATWIQLGQATGDKGDKGDDGEQGETGPQGPQGPQGNPGVGGDSMFADVDYSSSADYVIFILGNGTQIQVPTWSAFQTLQAQCDQMNSNIEALQVIVNALQNNDYVTGVNPIYEGGKEVGYVITFSKSGSVTIYHGKDGAPGQNGVNGEDGKDGVDGATPVIGVKKDVDGIYYWTLNGDWLLDDNGNKVKAEGKDGQNGSNGSSGSNGQNGSNGKDGVTPQLKIENGFWYVSYDNGATWTQLGQATGDKGDKGDDGEQGEAGPQGPQGPQGTPGVGGDSMFADVDYSSSTDYVIFTLGNGTQIQVPTWSAFQALQAQCDQMNSNIEALQVIVNALQNNDYVTGVNPIYEGGKEVGYVITFSKSGSVTIYHGQDGKDGQNGAPGKDGEDGEDGKDGVDGATPIIGVKKDVDGIYYWTLNGEWLLDADGNKVKAEGKDGQNGSNGSSGSNGQNGSDGVTPQLKIENGYWYVSYDNGVNWTQLGQATGDKGEQGETGPQGPQGPQGTPGVGGDSMFADVDYSSSTDYVIFTLGNGTQIQVPTWSAFQALQAQCDQMNSNIEALQVIVNALQNNDYVTGVSPIYESGKEIGYIITFSKSGSVTIYHGQDGKDGQNGAPGQNGINGQDGQTPVIGIKKDTDGIYYWTLNGDWLLDDNGNKVKAEGKDGQNGSNGSSGSNGQNGSDGKDGVTPQLKIEDGYWYVSYDNGVNWTQVGKATGDKGDQGEAGPQGPQGNPGTNGDSFFSSVTQDENYVYLVLTNGETIVIPKSEPNPATLTLGDVSGSSATFNGTVSKTSLDLKVTVYYSTSSNLTVYKYTGKASQTEFDGNSFVLTLSGLQSDTKYYYFVETVYNGKTYYSEVSSFNTGAGSDLDMNPEEGNM